MPKAINTQTNQAEEVGYDDLPKALLSGTHNLAAGSTVNLFDPDGNPVQVAAEDAYRAVKEQGFQFPTQKGVDSVLQKQDQTEKFGSGAANTAEAALAGAARGATFGLSDQALTKTGLVEPETLKGLQEENPIASGAGNLAGIAGSLLGAGALKGASLVGKVSGASDAIAHSALAQKIIGKYGAQFLGSAVEGAAYGAGNVISEQALGDPGLNAEKVLSEVGLSSILGGSLGVGFKAFGDVAPKAVEYLNKAKDSIIGRAENTAAKGIGTLTGQSTDDILNLIKNRGGLLDHAESDKLSSDLAKNLDNQYRQVNKASLTATSKIRPEEVGALVDNSFLPEAQKALGTHLSEITDAINTIEENPSLYRSTYSEQLKNVAKDINKVNPASAADIAIVLNKAKNKIQEFSKYSKTISPELTPTIDLMRKTATNLQHTLEDEGTFGAAAGRQAAYNRAVSKFISVQDDFKKEFMRKISSGRGQGTHIVNPQKLKASFNNEYKQGLLDEYQTASKELVDQIDQTYKVMPAGAFDKESVHSVIDKSSHLHAAGSENAELVHTLKQSGKFGIGIRALANLEKTANKNSSTISSLSKSVFNTTEKATKSLSFSAADYENTVKNLQSHAQDIGQLSTSLDQATQQLQNGAPNTAASLSMAAASAVAFLNSKIPQTPHTGIFDHKAEPSTAEKRKFMHYYSVVHNPMIALKELKQGTLRPETIETLSQVYPKQYQEMQKSVMEHLTNKGPKNLTKGIPYSKQMMLNMFLGSNMNESLTPQAILANQQAFQKPQAGSQRAPAAQGSVRPSQTGLKNLDRSGAATTPAQAATTREAP